MVIETCHDARHKCVICRGARPELRVLAGKRRVALHRSCASTLLEFPEIRPAPCGFFAGTRVQNLATGTCGTVKAHSGGVVHIAWD